MGYIKHHTIVVTGWGGDHLKDARDKAVEIFDEAFKTDSVVSNGSQIISPIVGSVANGQGSFFIAPDGSKEGWDPSDRCNDARKEFLDWLEDDANENYSEYIEVVFGGDDSYQEVLRSNLDKPEEE